jgi:acyl dehydratase
MEGRFSSPVYPGEAIRTEMWMDGNVVTFRATVPTRGVTVLNNGRAEISATR